MLSAIEKRRIKKIIYSKVTLGVLTVLLILLGRSTWDVYKKAAYADGNKERALQELAQLHARESFLNQELANLKSERGQEAQLRERFDVGREGERLIVLVDTPAPESEAASEQKSVWGKIKNLFGFGK